MSDPDEHTVFEALSDEDFDFRTVDGISSATGLPMEKVQDVLEQHSDLVRISAVPGRNKEPLYTLASRPVTAREKLALAQSVVEKSVS